MRFRKIALALFACMAVAAVAAGSAQAQWTIGTAGNALGASAHEKVEINKHPGTTLRLDSTVLGAPITLTAENVHCAAGVECTIDGENFGTNHSTGTLEFTNVTVDPSTCSVPNNKVVTEALEDEVIMDPSNAAGPVFDKFKPAGAGTTFATIELTGAECPFAGVVAPVKGTATGEAVKTNGSGGFEPVATGVLQTPQTLLFGETQQTTGGGALTLGKAAAVLSGAVDNTLAGTAHKGEAFGADE